jgi:hypothetical protein
MPDFNISLIYINKYIPFHSSLAPQRTLLNEINLPYNHIVMANPLCVIPFC